MALLLTVGYLDIRDQARRDRIAREGAIQAFKRESCPHCGGHLRPWDERLHTTNWHFVYVEGFAGPFYEYDAVLSCKECGRSAEYLITDVGSVELVEPDLFPTHIA